MTTLAPIALFVYNRPAHTRQTVEALQKNALAKESDLIVFSDAPKTPDSVQAVREVRDYIGAYPFPNMLEAQITGENDSWVVRWYASLNAIKVEPSQEGRQAFERFFKQRQTGLLRRFVHKASALLKGCR